MVQFREHNSLPILRNDFFAQQNFPRGSLEAGPLVAVGLSTLSTLGILYFWLNSNKDISSARSTPLPGYGILGDKVNEIIELFLDALAVYVHK